MKKPSEKIEIDHNKHLLKFEDGTFELHIGTTGPIGADVYFFDEFARLTGKQRRSPYFWTEVEEINFRKKLK